MYSMTLATLFFFFKLNILFDFEVECSVLAVVICPSIRRLSDRFFFFRTQVTRALGSVASKAGNWKRDNHWEEIWD